MGKIEGVHVLRAIAATMVVVCHAQLTVLGQETSGAAGVDIFFVISGFVMALTTSKPLAADFVGRSIQVRSFIEKRIWRIVPLYWLVLMWTARHDYSFAVLKDFFFIPRLNPAIPGMIKPVLAQGWTLNFEMMFYAIFAVGMLAGRYRWIAVAGGLLALPMLTSLGLSGIPAIFYSDTIVLEFGFGIVLYYTVLRGFPDWSRLTYLAILALGFGVLLTAWNTGPRFIVSGIPAFVIVWASFRACEGWLRPFRLLGDSSYAIYLVHWTAFGALKHFHGPLMIPIYVATGVFGGVAVHLLIEKRILSRKRERVVIVPEPNAAPVHR